MKVRVRMFGVLAERAGVSEEMLDLPPGSSARDVIAEVGSRYPAAGNFLGRVALAVNLESASADQSLSEDDEVALLPPVAGGAAAFLTGLREAPAVAEALAAVADPAAGGTVVFLGSVRDHGDAGPVERLEYSAYEEMADRLLRRIAEEAAERWSLSGVAILHAVGNLGVGEPTVVVACSAAHRSEAFAGCRYVIDEVKRCVPIWKKEIGPGGERWVGVEAGS